MLRNLIFICLFAVNGYAVTGFTWFWNVKLAGDTATVLRLKSNYDSTLNWSNRISDTLNRKVVHFGSGSLTHDSTLRYLRVDTLRSNPNVDSITIRHAFIDTLHGLLYNKGRVVSDTTATTYGSATYFTGDSIYNRAICNTGTVTSDSANIRSIGGTTKTDSINSIKGIKAPIFVGPLVGNVTGISDSATGAVRATKLTTARTISGTSFDGSANVTIIPDSAKGAHHLNGGVVNADSLNVHGTVIQKNGYTGIGTESPGCKLHIKSTSTTPSFRISNADYNGANTGSSLVAYLGATSGNTYSAISSWGNGDLIYNNLVLQGGGGNVGIGTISPISPLTVKGNFVDTGNALITGTLTVNDTLKSFGHKLTPDTGSFTINLFDNGGTIRATGTASYSKIGNNISMFIPAISSAYQIDHLSGFPAFLKTSKVGWMQPVTTFDASNNTALYLINTQYVIGANDTAWTIWQARGLGSGNLPIHLTDGGLRSSFFLNYIK